MNEIFKMWITQSNRYWMGTILTHIKLIYVLYNPQTKKKDDKQYDRLLDDISRTEERMYIEHQRCDAQINVHY